MAASRVINQQSFHDGKFVLYQLENRPKQLWLCRLKVPNGSGYIYRGTGTSEFYEARKFAEDLLEDIRIRTKLGQSITGPNLAIIAFLQTYAIPYFTKNKITNLNQKETGKFFDWLRENSKRKSPKETTILQETSEFSTFLRWCFRRGRRDRKLKPSLAHCAPLCSAMRPEEKQTRASRPFSLNPTGTLSRCVPAQFVPAIDMCAIHTEVWVRKPAAGLTVWKYFFVVQGYRMVGDNKFCARVVGVYD